MEERAKSSQVSVEEEVLVATESALTWRPLLDLTEVRTVLINSLTYFVLSSLHNSTVSNGGVGTIASKQLQQYDRVNKSCARAAFELFLILS